MTAISKDEWLLAETLVDQRDSFILWMIEVRLCSTRNDFREHFENIAWIDTVLEGLEARGLIDSRYGKLRLTTVGREAVFDLQTTYAAETRELIHRFLDAPAMVEPRQRIMRPQSRGTLAWAFDRLRSSILPALIDDLARRETEGLRDDQCTQVQIALANLTNTATELPDDFYGSGWHDFARFEELYIQWNSIAGDSSEAVRQRRRILMRMRRQRHRIARRMKTLRHVMVGRADPTTFERIVEPFTSLYHSFPHEFSGLRRATAPAVRYVCTK